LRVLGKRALGRIFRPKEDEMMGGWRQLGWACSAFGGNEKGLKGRVYSEDLGVDGRILLKWVLVK
jgi:hypothetical protein